MSNAGKTAQPAASPVARRLAAELNVDLNSVAGSGPRGRIVRSDVEAAASGAVQTAPPPPAPSNGVVATPPAGSRPLASPSAARLADDLGVDIKLISGSGPGGRIVRSDVEDAAAAIKRGDAPSGTPPEPAPTSATPASAGAAEGDTAKGQTQVVELTRVQQIVARRMSQAKATVPEFTVQTEVDMTRALALRAELKELASAETPSVNDIVVKAVAVALREHPRANGSFVDGHFELYSRVNVGVAVASADALLVPTVFDADLKPLDQITRETRALAERARAGKITSPELSGGTFTVSNLGMFGVTRFSAVINPPQAGILAVGATVERMRVRDGQPVVTQVMDLTLSCDHRILYGADAARFLARVRELLEHPAAMLLQGSAG